MTKIFIATPIHRAGVEQVAAASDWARRILDPLGIPGQLGLVTNCPWLDCARADLVAAFLRSDCTHLLFRDDDIDFPPSVLQRMISAGEPLVAVPYRMRHPPHAWAVTEIGFGPTITLVGLGATLITAEALRDVHRWGTCYYQDGEPRTGAFIHHPYLMAGRFHLLKEDHAFFYRAHLYAGLDVTLIPGAVSHAGVKSEWPDPSPRNQTVPGNE